MQQLIHTSTRVFIILIATLSLFSCSKDANLSNLEETLIVRHKNADMPAYIFGNGTEKIFLITLHGGPGDLGLGFRSTMFKEQIESEYAVVYFDQRGSGMSQGSYDENGINIDIMAEDVLALVQVIKKNYGDDSRFFMLGHSWGGTLGTATLLKDQDEFLGWIELDGAHNPSGIYFEYLTTFERVADEQIALGNSIEYWESVKELVYEVDRNSYSDDDFYKLNGESFDAERELESAGFINEPNNDADLIFEYDIFAAIWNIGIIQSIFIDQGLFESVDYTPRLSEITIPSLFLWGKYDMVVPPIYGQQAFDSIGSTIKELVIFENSGHSPLASEPDLFAETVLRFMNDNK